ncbi:hypothetical protein ACFQE1_22020, partial [Halobium palmae]
SGLDGTDRESLRSACEGTGTTAATGERGSAVVAGTPRAFERTIAELDENSSLARAIRRYVECQV